MPSSKSKNYRPAKKPWTGQKGSPQTNKQTTSSSNTRFSYQERSQRPQQLRKYIDLLINQIVSHSKVFLHEEVKNFQAGYMSKHVKAWEEITTDSYILDINKKYKLFNVTKFILVLPMLLLIQQSLSRTRG